MQIALKRMRQFAALAALMAAICVSLAHAEPADQIPDTPEGTVKRLYRNYAWQALGGSSFDCDQVFLLHQSLSELEKYFEPGLAKLIRKGDECEKKSEEICTPDFDYIFDSQDNAAADLEISPVNEKNIVRVKFNNPPARLILRLNYQMVKTENGWRIADIYYVNDKASLRASLRSVFQLLNYPLDAPLAQAAETTSRISDTPSATVKRLYRDDAWMSIGAKAFNKDLRPLERQTLPELGRYFENGLATLIQANRDCMESKGTRCTLLNGGIIFDSKDPNAVEFWPHSSIEIRKRCTGCATTWSGQKMAGAFTTYTT